MLCVLTVSSRNAVCFSFATTQPVRQRVAIQRSAERCMAALPLPGLHHLLRMPAFHLHVALAVTSTIAHKL